MDRPLATTAEGPDRTLIALLADGGLHSGAALAAALGLSRAAVHKALHRASERLGCPIETARGQGYRLAQPVELLDAARIAAALPEASGIGAIEVHTELDSTSSQLLRQGAAGAAGAAGGLVCLAERQTAGRGRQGRGWVAPFGGSLTLSILWRLRRPPAELGGLSLAAGVAVLDALAAASPGLRLVDRDAGHTDSLGLKWPNDLHWRRRKLAGLLLEVSAEAQGPSQVVLGLGLNLRIPAAAGAPIDQPWVDLAGILAAGGLPLPSRNALAAALIARLADTLTAYEARGFAPFIAPWQRRDAYRGEPAMVIDGASVSTGTLAGIADDGALLLDTAQGRRRVLAGEVSLRVGG